jgi:hypothetical protein
MPYYYFHLCLGSQIIAHDMVGRECENHEAARQHARNGGGAVRLDPPMPDALRRYQIEVVNEAGEKVFLFPLSGPVA